MLGFIEIAYYGIDRGAPGDKRIQANIRRMRSAGRLIPLNRGSGEGTQRAIARELADERARQAQYARLDAVAA